MLRLWKILHVRLLAVLLIALLLVAAAPSVTSAQRSADPSPGSGAAARVKAKIEGAQHAREALVIIHLGCQSDGATVRRVTTVRGADGQILPGEFATVVRYHWTDLGGNKGWSEMTYFFDANGRYLEFRVSPTTARFLKQFSEAKLAVAALADLILPNVRNPRVREQMRGLIEAARIEDLFHLKMALDFP
jgi:hypothetical protein